MMKIGERFKELRIKNELNQIEFAKKVGISQSTLSEIEKGKSKPSVDTVISTSNSFNITTDWILKGK
jgi:DNA-binding XRE family transcriptional regulator